LFKNKVAVAPPLIQDGSKDDSDDVEDEDGKDAGVNKASGYSQMEPSLKATV